MTLKVLRQEWWLNTPALPKLWWARFNFYGDHHIEVLEFDGEYESFTSERSAKEWLREGEYEELQALIRKGAVPLDTEPPNAESDTKLLPKMARTLSEPICVKRRRGVNVPLLLGAIFVAIVIVAVKNSETCQDRPGGSKRLGIRSVNNEPIIPCQMECCRSDPWTCRCTGRCPCIPILRSKQQ
jgi:hypothetical protein